ncbi:hypothetical protein PoB_001674300 [Plakobranchus ocellatus]|uniref:Uncharacterized protein n=1 Tax=Plakobranchus ocellatus TaxID=259542 RepID=A0AAV3Z6K8_9GAST|nr:hypothetical protein PoB_001674300 [Plakobranchus ocellatus]
MTVGVSGNEIANGLGNERRTQPQPRKPSTLSDVMSVLRRSTAELWSAAQMMRDSPNFMKLSREMIIGRVCTGHRSNAVQNFSCKSESRAPAVGPSVTRFVCPYYVVYAGSERSRFLMFYANVGNGRMSAPQDGLPCP